MTNILSSKAMLASLRITQWTARKIDKKVTHETNSAHGASADAGRYNKALLAKDALASMLAISNAARTEHYAKTLPWLDDGARILPAMIYQDYANKMREYRESFEKAVAGFVSDYPSFVNDARNRLNGMFNESDYPTAQSIAAKFSFGVGLQQIPEANDFRVDVGNEQARAIKADIEARAMEALQNATNDAWKRIAETVGHMSAKLSEFKPASRTEKAIGIFRDSLVENVKELVGILPAFNLSNDARLTDICNRMQQDLCSYDADDLRNSDLLREKVKAQAQAILSDVSEIMG